MADLTDQQAAQTVKIAGAASTGIESNYAQVDSNGSVQTRLKDSSGNDYTSSNRFPVDANLQSGQLVPTITNKLRFRYAISNVSLPNTNAFQTIFSRSGTGLFFGAQLGFNHANVSIRLTIDSGVVFTLPLNDIKSFEFNDTTDGRMQMGGFLTAVGNVFDFSSRFAIPYTTSILIEAASNDGAAHTLQKYMAILTEDT